MRLSPTNEFIKRLSTALVLGCGFWAVFIYFPPIYFTAALLIILATIIVFEWKRLFPISKPIFWILMPLYPILPFALLIAMNHHPLYHELLFILFILVFSFDTGGYVVGNIIGKHQVCPVVSPGKTWEGILGGYIFAIIGLKLIMMEQGLYKPWWFIMTFACIVCTLSFAGDLFESQLKRRARIKDSGFLLPGHGGFLDRFDGILFAVFFFYFLKDYLVIALNT